MELGGENDINLSYSTRTLGEKNFELTNHLGNVLAVVSDKKILNDDNTTYRADVISTTDYYPFGMMMPGRTVNNSYRYGFGGHEKINEVKSNGNWYDFGNYGYMPQIGRRPGLDPVDQIGISNYAAFGNNPIRNIDPDGSNTKKYVTIMI